MRKRLHNIKLVICQEAWLATDLVTDLTDGWPQEAVGWVERFAQPTVNYLSV